MRYLVLLVLIAAGFSSSSYAEIPFSANDLAIMFPLDTSTSLPKQKVTLKNSQWRLVSVDNFNRVLKAAAVNGVYLNAKLIDPSSWYLVGLRYTPCSFSVGVLKPCAEQIRFVFQPFKTTGDQGFDDYALHVLYTYNEGQEPALSPRLESFRILKNKFGEALKNKTLKPNAVLDSKLADDYFKTLQSEVIENHVNTRIATKMTFMGLGRLDGSDTFDAHDWKFFGGTLNASGQWDLNKLPTGHDDSVEQFSLDEEGAFNFNIKPLAGHSHLIEGETEDQIRSAVNILNPKKTNDHNVDCASCHIADQYVFPVIFDDSVKKNFTTRVMGLFKNRPRLTEVVINNEIHTALQATEAPIPRVFGYLGSNALISQRMVLDNADAVESANSLLNLKVTPQCQNDKQRVAFIECVYFENSKNVSQCLAQTCY